MDELLSKLPEWVQQIPVYLTVLVMVATALVRLPPLAKYEDDVEGVVKIINKVLAWMPTFGKNPSTKELEKKVKT